MLVLRIALVIVSYMDSDLQDPPELITELIKQHEKGFDIVHTKRTKGWVSQDPNYFTNLAYAIIDKLSDINLKKDVGDFKLISKRALKKILEQKNIIHILEVYPYGLVSSKHMLTTLEKQEKQVSQSFHYLLKVQYLSLSGV